MLEMGTARTRGEGDTSAMSASGCASSQSSIALRHRDQRLGGPRGQRQDNGVDTGARWPRRVAGGHRESPAPPRRGRGRWFQRTRTSLRRPAAACRWPATGSACPTTCTGNRSHGMCGDGVSEMQVLRQDFVFQRQHDLDQTRDPGRRLKVPDVRLHRSHQQRPTRLAVNAERRGGGLHLDRVTERTCRSHAPRDSRRRRRRTRRGPRPSRSRAAARRRSAPSARRRRRPG